MSERLNTGSIPVALVAAANAGAERARALHRRDVARNRLGRAVSRLEAVLDAEDRLAAARRR